MTKIKTIKYSYARALSHYTTLQVGNGTSFLYDIILANGNDFSICLNQQGKRKEFKVSILDGLGHVIYLTRTLTYRESKFVYSHLMQHSIDNTQQAQSN